MASFLPTMILVVVSVCAVIALLNWVGFVHAILRGRPYVFAPPILCALIASFAMLFHPMPVVSSLAWVPFLVDPSVGAFLVAYSFQAVRQRMGRVRGQGQN